MGSDRLTLLDLAKQTDPDGRVAMVAEVLDQTNAIIQDAPTYPSNAQLAERTTIRSSLPTVAAAQVNKGIARSKSSSKQRVDTIMMVSALSEVDTRVRNLLGGEAFNQHRWKEDKAFLEAIAQFKALKSIYGDENVSSLEFTGLAARLSTLQSAISGSQVVSMGSVVGSDGTSIYIVDWSEDYCHLIHPRDSKTVGIDIRTLPEQLVTDIDGTNKFPAAITEFELLTGLTVKDDRHVARLCNIDTSDANLSTPTQGLIIEALIDIMSAMPPANGAQRVMYCNHKIVGAFMKQAINKSNAALSMMDYLGKPTAHFWDVPIRRCDAITSSESTVS